MAQYESGKCHRPDDYKPANCRQLQIRPYTEKYIKKMLKVCLNVPDLQVHKKVDAKTFTGSLDTF